MVRKWMLLCSLAGLLMLFAGSAATAADFSFSLDIPDTWRRVVSDRYLVITRDGALKHYIFVQQRPLHRRFKYSRKRIDADMRPEAAARVIIAELTADEKLTDLRLLEKVSTEIDGNDGFRLTFTYKDPTGLESKTIYYGFIADDMFYNLRYWARDPQYFRAEALHEVGQILDTFRLNPESSDGS